MAFPVFTKVLAIDAADAQTFSLSIQAVGMGAAALTIVLAQRDVHWRAVAIATPTAIAGLLVGTAISELGLIPDTAARVAFSIAAAGVGAAMLAEIISPLPEGLARPVGIATVALAGLLGGGLSAMVGSGANVAVYIVLVLRFGLDPRVGVPTSVIVMAIVSAVGLALNGIVLGGLSISPAADSVDLFALWLASVPVVACGAPLGAWIASRLGRRHLVTLVAALALAELFTTIIFLEELRSEPALAAALAIGIFAVGITVLHSHRARPVALVPTPGVPVP